MREYLVVFLVVFFSLGCINTSETKKSPEKELSDDQLFQTAIKLEDTSVCEKIRDPNRKNHCFMEVAKKTGDPHACENIRSLAMANTCKQDISKRKSSQKQN